MAQRDPFFFDKPYIATAPSPQCTDLDGGGRRCWQNKASWTLIHKVPGVPEGPSRAGWKSQPENAGSHSACVQGTGCISSARLEVRNHCKSGGLLAGVQCPAPRCLVALDSAVLMVGELQHLFDVHYPVVSLCEGEQQCNFTVEQNRRKYCYTEGF